MSVGVRRSTRACCLRTPCRADCGRPVLVHQKDTAPARGLSLSARTRGATFQLQPPTAGQPPLPHARRALLRLLSVRRRRSNRAFWLRKPCRPDSGWPLSIERTLRRREASLLRRAPVVRRASCDLHRQTSAACHTQRTRLRSLSIGRRCITGACCARVPCRAGCGQPCQ